MAGEGGRDAFWPAEAAALMDELEAELTLGVDAMWVALSGVVERLEASGDDTEAKAWLGRLDELLRDLGAIDDTPEADA